MERVNNNKDKEIDSVIVKNLLKVNNVVLIGLLINIFDRHLRVKVFVEIQEALPIMIDGTFSQIPLTTIF